MLIQNIIPEEIKEIRKMEGKTALHMCAMAGYHDALSILLNFSPDHNILSDEGKTALDYALEATHTKCIELLENYQEQKSHLQISIT